MFHVMPITAYATPMPRAALLLFYLSRFRYYAMFSDYFPSRHDFLPYATPYFAFAAGYHAA